MVTGAEHAEPSMVSSRSQASTPANTVVAHFGATALWKCSVSRSDPVSDRFSASAAHPVSLMHAVAIAVRFVNGFPPDISRMRWPRPSSRLPHPAVAAPNVISIRPHPARGRHWPDRTKSEGRWRSNIHARIEDDMIAGRQRQDYCQGRC